MIHWHAQHRGRTLGRILHCLSVYCDTNHRLFENASVGAWNVFYHDTLVATYTWPDNPEDDVPTFQFYEFDPQYKLKTQFEENQFRKKPYLDDPELLMDINYIVQQVRLALSFEDALLIRHVRDNLTGDWDQLARYVIENLKGKIQRVLETDCYGHYRGRVKEIWKHMALCAVYSI